MSWFVRKKDYADIYKPRECPDYPDPDLFSIKLFHGGEFEENPKRYNGGDVDYIDNCNVDCISLIEMYSMLKECGDAGGAISIWYKLPGTDMERGLFELDNDDEVMTMCNLMPTCKYFELYVVVTRPLSQATAEGDTIGEGDPHLSGIEFENMATHESHATTNNGDGIFTNEDPADQIPVEVNHGNESQAENRSRRKGSVLSFDFEWPDSTQFEMEMEEEFRAEEGVYKDFSDFEDEEEGQVHDNDDSSSVSSFYSDESNKDQSDDDLIFERNVDEDVEDILDEDSGEDRQVNLDDDCDTDDDSVYANSDEERMCGNSTDDETNINKYPAFNEDVDMANPIFEIGLCFKSSGLFRKAVKKHAIIERRPISNVRNYGKKVKYVCEAPCEWKIYAAPIKNTTTYQIRQFNRNHTCMPTFKQKQINSTWIAEHYLNEIRMNPSWPVPNFHKKIVNDLKCDVLCCVVTWSGGTAYSVTCSDGGHELVVDLFKQTCTCRKWELTGIPCYHAAACINFKNDPWEKYINACYTKKCYMNLYNHTLHPIVGPEFWEQTDYPRPLPPLIKPQTGRPKKKRVRHNDIPTNQADPTRLNARVNTMVNCTYCKASGHNCRTCPSKISDQAAQGVPLQPKKKGTVKCKACGNTGHNSRTCKKDVEGTEEPRPQEGSNTEKARPQEGTTTEEPRPRGGSTSKETTRKRTATNAKFSARKKVLEARKNSA